MLSLAGWWCLLACLLWVCFLRPQARSLAATLDWFQVPSWPLLASITLLLLGGISALLPDKHAPRSQALALSGLSCALLLTLWISVRWLP